MSPLLLLALSLNAAPTPAPPPVPPPGPRDLGAITLPDAIRRALERNFTVQVFRYDPAIAAQEARAAAGAFDPVLAAGASTRRAEASQGNDPISGIPRATVVESEAYNAGLSGLLPSGARYELGVDVNGVSSPTNLFPDEFNSFAGLRLTQPLLNGFGRAENLALLRVARAGAELADWEFRQVLIDLVTEVSTSYYVLLFTRRNFELSESSRRLAEQLLRENRRRVELGTMAEVDTLQADAQLALREDRVITARRIYENQKVRFLSLLTDEIEHLLTLQFDPGDLPTAEPPVVDVLGDFQTALAQRPDYRQALIDLETREILLARDTRRALPSLDVYGQVGYSGYSDDFGGSLDQVGSFDYETVGLGASFSYPLLNRTPAANQLAARLRRNRSEAALAQLRQRILVEVDSAARRLRSDWERISASRRAREINLRSLLSEEKRLELGDSSSFIVLRLQADLAEAEIQEVLAQTDFLSALALYDQALGLTLQRHQVEPVSAPLP